MVGKPVIPRRISHRTHPGTPGPEAAPVSTAIAGARAGGRLLICFSNFRIPGKCTLDTAKIEADDEIRVIAPSKSLRIIAPEVRETVRRRLEALGFRVTVSTHAEEMDRFRCLRGHPPGRPARGLCRSEAKGILTAIGGYSCNQLLKKMGL